MKPTQLEIQNVLTFLIEKRESSLKKMSEENKTHTFVFNDTLDSFITLKNILSEELKD